MQTSLLLFKKNKADPFQPSPVLPAVCTSPEHPTASAQLQPPSKTAHPWVTAGEGRAVPAVLPSACSPPRALLRAHLGG